MTFVWLCTSRKEENRKYTAASLQFIHCVLDPFDACLFVLFVCRCAVLNERALFSFFLLFFVPHPSSSFLSTVFICSVFSSRTPYTLFRFVSFPRDESRAQAHGLLAHSQPHLQLLPKALLVATQYATVRNSSPLQKQRLIHGSFVVCKLCKHRLVFD